MLNKIDNLSKIATEAKNIEKHHAWGDIRDFLSTVKWEIVNINV